MLPIDQQQPALAAHRSVGGARRDDGAACVEGDVGDQHQPVRCAGDVGAAVDDQPAGQSAEQLVGDHAVVVRVVPVGAGRMVGGDAEEVVERRSRFDPHEGVVAGALRGDAKAVGVQVGRLVEPIGQADGELVAGADAQCRARGASVEAERGGVATGQPDAGRCGQLDRQPAVAAVEHRRLEQLGAGGVGREGPGGGVRGGGGDPSRDSGDQPDRAQASEDQGASTADRGGLHRRSVGAALVVVLVDLAAGQAFIEDPAGRSGPRCAAPTRVPRQPVREIAEQREPDDDERRPDPEPAHHCGAHHDGASCRGGSDDPRLAIDGRGDVVPSSRTCTVWRVSRRGGAVRVVG